MKKLLMGSFVLTIFSISLLIFQLSCKKEAVAQTGSYVLHPATTSALGGVIVGSGLNINNSGVLSVAARDTSVPQLGKLLFVELSGGLPDQQTICTSNYDGTGKVKIPISLPTSREFRSIPVHATLSPDGKMLFFEAYEGSTQTYFIYSCSINGSNLQIVHSSSKNLIGLMNAY
ncbi:MAG: hypothetical protein HYR66_05225 [Sphingobacteriales bacterium]|nr:hypothetical protein [Sphingobacteriales bacterium]MBI3718788.1 hypothetical protein [Sphingobacteriales bacterium]